MSWLRSTRSEVDEQGASAVEYALLVASIAGVIVLIIFALGSVVHGLFGSTCSRITGQTTTTVNCSG